MADSVKIKITGDASDFNKTLSGAGKSAADVFKGVMASQVVTKGVSMLTQGLRSSIQTGMEFSAAMSQVAAISGATDAELAKLTETAKHYGETTMFSASQAADALNYMALAGWDANQSIDALGGVLNLAAASGMDLGAASDAVTDYLSAFGMEASKAGYMADLMAYAQSRSNTSATQLAAAYGNCASSMHAAGQDIETTTAVLMTLANQGIKGAEAGTQMSAVMRDLTSKMENGQIMIGKTAVAVQDAQGNFRDLNAILTDVAKATDGMGTAEKSAALMETFTARSIKAVNVLLSEGLDGVNAYEEALRGSEGTAADQAKTMMDNLAGDVKIFQSALEGVQITASEKLDDAARAIVQEGTSVLEAISLGGKTGGIGGMADALFDQIPELVPKATKGMEKLLGGVGKRLPGLMTNMLRSLPSILSGAGTLAPVLIESLTGAAGAAIEGLIANLPGMIGGLASSLPGIITSGLKGAGSILGGILSGIDKMNDADFRKYKSLGTVTGEIDIDATVDYAAAQAEVDKQLQEFVEYLKGKGLTTEQVAQVLAFKGTQDELAAWLDANFPNLDQAAKDAIMAKFTATGEGGLAGLFTEGEKYGLTTEDIAQLMVSTDLTEDAVRQYLTDHFPNLDDAAKNAILDKLPKTDEGGGLSTLFSEGEAQGLTTEQVAALIMDTDLTEESVQAYLEEHFPDLSSAAKNAFTKALSGGEGGSLAETLKTDLKDLGISSEDIAAILTAQAEGDDTTVESILTEKYAGVKDEALNAIRAAFPEGGLGASLTSELQGLGISNADIVTLITAQAEGDGTTISSLLEEKYAGVKQQAIDALTNAWKNSPATFTSGAENGSAGFLTGLIEDMFTNGLSEDDASIDAVIEQAKGIANAKIQELRDYINGGGEDVEGATEAISMWENWLDAIQQFATGYANASTAECRAAAKDVLDLASTTDEATARILANSAQLTSYQGRLFSAGARGTQLSEEDTVQAFNFILGQLDQDLSDAEEAKRKSIELGKDYAEVEKNYNAAIEAAQSRSRTRLLQLIRGQAKGQKGLGGASALASIWDQLLVGDGFGGVEVSEVERMLRENGFDDNVIQEALGLVLTGPNGILNIDNLGDFKGTAGLEGLNLSEPVSQLIAELIEEGPLDPALIINELQGMEGVSNELLNQILIAMFGVEGNVTLPDIDQLLSGVDFAGLGNMIQTAAEAGLIEGVSAGDAKNAQFMQMLIASLIGESMTAEPVSVTIPVEATPEPTGDPASEISSAVQEETGGETETAVTVTQDVEANVGNVTVNGAEAIGQMVDSQAASGNTGAQLSSATSSAVGTAINSGRSAAGGASSVGSAIASGLASGIRNNMSSVISAAKAAVEQAISAAKSAADAHSPSRKMMELGKWYDEGLAIGIADNASMVVDQAVRLSKRAIGAINTKPMLDLSAIAGTVDGALHDIAGIESGRPVVLAINGRELGRVTAADTAIEQNAYNRRVAISYGQGGRL